MRLNKATINAIERALPLFITVRNYRLELRALTVINENGSTRDRLLYHGQFPTILAVCATIFEQGGAIDIETLPWRELNLWDFGWTPELAAARDQLRDLWRNRSVSAQPQW